VEPSLLYKNLIKLADSPWYFGLMLVSRALKILKEFSSTQPLFMVIQRRHDELNDNKDHIGPFIVLYSRGTNSFEKSFCFDWSDLTNHKTKLLDILEVSKLPSSPPQDVVPGFKSIRLLLNKNFLWALGQEKGYTSLGYQEKKLAKLDDND